jgi:hypothetical protein
MSELTSHERGELKKREKEKKFQTLEHVRKGKKIKKVLLYSLPTIIFLVILTIFILVKGRSYQLDTSMPATIVHWHSDLAIDICSSRIPIPNPFPEHEQLGANMPALHTHNDGKIHMEGMFKSKEELSLGKFFSNLGIIFNSDQIMDYKNGNACNNGKENKVRMFVNDKENFDFDSFQLKDGDSILIKYE